MPSITLKEIPEDSHAQLKQEAALNAKHGQHWIDEALASSPETPLTRADMDKVRDRVLARGN